MGHSYQKNQKERGVILGAQPFPPPPWLLHIFQPPCLPSYPLLAFLLLTLFFHSRTMPWGNFPAEKGQLFRLPSALNR